MMKNIKNKKAFTIIELIVVVAILGILVLLAGPRLLGYVERAELARIQHDVKVMENKMAEVLTTDNKFDDWQNNGKDLGRVIMRKELYEKQGVAKSIDWEHLSAKWLRVNKDNDSELGMGGDLIEIDDKYSTYKIIPKEYSSKINTKLKGTFYVNSLGKVYYEHDKSLERAIEKESLACVAPETLNYEFKIINGLGTITKWNGTELHLIIPSSFLLEVDGVEQCVPVQVIGRAAFMQGDFKSILIPESVQIIEEDNFVEIDIEEIEIPHSVKHIGGGSFIKKNYSSGGSSGGRVIIRNKSGGITIGGGSFIGYTPVYKPPTAKDLGVIFNPSTGTIISSNTKNPKKNKVITIPDTIIVDNIEYPVKKIDKGAYQGLGLISVVLPEGLERIEDYAFAGNQLVGIRIPNSVYHIGNYAFAFNEVVHSITGHRKATIGFINIKDKEQFEKVDKYGNILENNKKAEYIEGNDGSVVRLLDHIFVTSIGNYVIDEEYTPDGCWRSQNGPVMFCGLSPAAFDGDESTAHSGAGTLTWHGDLEGKRLYISKKASTGVINSKITIQDSIGNNLNFINLDSNIEVSEISAGIRKANILIPKGAKRIIVSPASLVHTPIIYEIQVAENLKTPNAVSNITSTSDYSSVELSWSQSESDYEKALIYRNGEFISIADGHSYIDTPIEADTEYIYEIYAMNKYGSISNKTTHKTQTLKSDIIFKGLGPGAFDGDPTTTTSNGTITWDGNLNNKKVYLDLIPTDRYSGAHVKIYDSNGTQLNFIDLTNKQEVSHFNFRSSNTISRFIRDIIIPFGASEIKITGSVIVADVLAPENPAHPVIFNNISHSVSDNSILLKWDKTDDLQKAIIYRNDEIVAITEDDFYEDNFLYSDYQYKYKIIALNEYGNASNEVSNQIIKTSNSTGIAFRGANSRIFSIDNTTPFKGRGEITWIGNLSNKKVQVRLGATDRYETGKLYMYNSENEIINTISVSGTSNSQIHEIYIPDEAVSFQTNYYAALYYMTLIP